MAGNHVSAYRPLLDAIAFAARAHHGQMRKDKQTPYVSHAFRVCMVLREVFGISEQRILMAAVLHDTVEDTTTDFDDVEKHFGKEVAGWVGALSKDKRLPYEERESAYCAALAQAPWQVQVCKLADIYDNLLDMGYLPLEKRLDALAKKRRYLNALNENLAVEAVAAWQVVHQLHQDLEARAIAGR
jgi:guanosine-3',5'-bis(diphosphate) 3'-pyrophosphohydrolase